jgi:plastocyanin
VIRWAALISVALALGFGTAVLAAPHKHPAKRCHRQHHHKRRCTPRHKPKPKPKPKPGKPTPTTTTGTTTTTVTTTTTPPPTTTSPSGPLPSRLEVDENDQGDPPQPYSLRPSYNPVAAGVVQFNVYNFGQDPHTFAVVDSGGHRLAFAHAPANQSQTAVPVSANLAPGTYKLECTLSGHASLGMVATLTVR